MCRANIREGMPLLVAGLVHWGLVLRATPEELKPRAEGIGHGV